MEREIELDRENHALKVRILELEAREKEMERDILTLSRHSDLLRKELDAKTVKCEDLETRVEDAESELEEFRGMYCIPAPRSLTEEMELEERLRG